MIFADALIFVGAIMTMTRPARGFLIFGAGFLSLGISLLVLERWDFDLLRMIGFVSVPGLLYTWLGMKQLVSDRA